MYTITEKIRREVASGVNVDPTVVGGLSAVEPGFRSCQPNNGRQSRDSSESSALRETYSPTTNFMLDRQFPVPLESQIHQEQIAKDFEEHNAATITVVEQRQDGITQFDRVLSSVATSSINQIQSMPLISLNTAALDAVPDESVSVSNESVPADREPTVDGASTVAMEFQESTSEDNRQAVSTPLQDEPSTSHTFMDLLDVQDVGDDIVGELTRPLLDCLSPLNTPVNRTRDRINAEAVRLQSHTSPHTPPEDVSSFRAAHKVPLLTNRTTEAKKGMIRKKKVSFSVTVLADKVTNVRSKVKPAGGEKNFKIPLKPSRNQTARRDYPAGTNKERFESYRNQHDRPNENVRNRPAATDFRRSNWTPRQSYSSGYLKDSLTAEQRRWLNRMPSGWRH